MSEKKKRILYHSNAAWARTGFGRVAKALLRYLYKTGKYEIHSYCSSTLENDPALNSMPWKCYGSIPANQAEINKINQDQVYARKVSYGMYFVDKVVKEVKPHVAFFVEDFWGVDYCIHKSWFDKINSVIWTTLDSLPILPHAVNEAPNIKNYWVWSTFAEKEMKKLGHEHVITVPGCIESKHFKPLKQEEKLSIRKINNIDENAFIVGFVFRNQLRKSVPNLLKGFVPFLYTKEGKNAYILFHTNFTEGINTDEHNRMSGALSGWNIPSFVKELGIDPKRVLCTYVCEKCKKYEIKPYSEPKTDCRFCGGKHTQRNPDVKFGVTEPQLNEIYNLMDYYCHPFTSGGLEIPIIEAKMAGLITGVTSYACGLDHLDGTEHSIALEWDEYREPNPGTQFIKATTRPDSIFNSMVQVASLTKEERIRRGLLGRKFALNKFDVYSVGPIFEKFIDNAPEINYDFNFEQEKKNPEYPFRTDIKDDKEYVIDLYSGILKCYPDEKGLNDWLSQLQLARTQEDKNRIRYGIYNFFKKTAIEDNRKNQAIDFNDLLSDEGWEKRVLYVVPESAGDVYLSTSLFESIREAYPDCNLYVATKPEYESIIKGNPYVFRWLPYTPEMENLLLLEGYARHKGYFKVAFLPHIGTQKHLDYIHNGATNIQFDLERK